MTNRSGLPSTEGFLGMWEFWCYNQDSPGQSRTVGHLVVIINPKRPASGSGPAKVLVQPSRACPMHCLVLWFVVGLCPTLPALSREMLPPPSEKTSVVWALSKGRKLNHQLRLTSQVSVSLWVCPGAQGSRPRGLAPPFLAAFSHQESSRGRLPMRLLKKRELLSQVGRKAGWPFNPGSRPAPA